MKKYFSSHGVFGIATILSFFLLPYTVGPVVRFFVPASTGLAAFPLTAIFAPPLLLLIIPLLPIIVTKIFIGNRKYIIWLILYILFFSMANLYDLSKEDALFKIPFLRANIAPITWFELADREKGIGVKLYTPTRQIQDFKPLEYMGTIGSCGDLTLSYRDPYWSRLEIREIPRSCEKRDNMLNSAAHQKYEEIYNKDGIVVQFEATPPSTNDTFFRWLHKIYIGDTLVIIYPTPFNKLSREEVIRLAQSLK